MTLNRKSEGHGHRERLQLRRSHQGLFPCKVSSLYWLMWPRTNLNTKVNQNVDRRTSSIHKPELLCNPANNNQVCPPFAFFCCIRNNVDPVLFFFFEPNRNLEFWIEHRTEQKYRTVSILRWIVTPLSWGNRIISPLCTMPRYVYKHAWPTCNIKLGLHIWACAVPLLRQKSRLKSDFFRRFKCTEYFC